MRRLFAVACLILFAAALGGCGNKGALYLPRTDTPAGARTAAPAPAATAPAPAAH